MKYLESVIKNNIALVTLKNPPLNVITRQMTRELCETFVRLQSNKKVHVLVLTGAGEKAFCAGSDIKEFNDFIGKKNGVIEQKLSLENEMYKALYHFSKPTIAALNGHALGGGLELAVCCDILVADSNAKFSFPEVRLGVFCGSGGTFRVPRRIGEGRTKEMMMLGEPIDAATALAWGLINRVAEPGKTLDSAMALASHQAKLPGRALQLCKKAIALCFENTEDSAIEQTLQLSDQVFNTDDVKEGVRAFFAKQSPVFKHR